MYSSQDILHNIHNFQKGHHNQFIDVYTNDHPNTICDQIADTYVVKALEQDFSEYAAIRVTMKNKAICVSGNIGQNVKYNSRAIIDSVIFDSKNFTVFENIDRYEIGEDMGVASGYADTFTEHLRLICHSLQTTIPYPAHVQLRNIQDLQSTPIKIGVSVPINTTSMDQQKILEIIKHHFENPIEVTFYSNVDPTHQVYTSGTTSVYAGLHPFHILRCGTIMAQLIAEFVVSRNFATHCSIFIFYGTCSIGTNKLDYTIDTHNAESISIAQIYDAIRQHFGELTPDAIVQYLIALRMDLFSANFR